LSPPTCVVHLVWAPLGVEPLRRFRDSYLRHPAGVEHRLLLLYNGCGAGADLAAWESELVDVPHQVLRTDRPVQDLDAYRYAAERIDAESFCFLNSHSVLLADGWLAALASALRQAGTGLVGASGSWASMRSLARYDLGLGGPYRHVFDSRSEVRSQLAALGTKRSAATANSYAGPLGKLRVAARVLEQTSGSFPVAHVRTNGFMLARDTLLSLRWPSLRRKAHAHRLESGAESITAQVKARGLVSLVVARDGGVFEPARWPLSRTFWQGAQENLMIADNQTADYAEGDAPMRRFLARYAWGREADPARDGPLEAAIAGARR
jgi:hypothetical protein